MAYFNDYIKQFFSQGGVLSRLIVVNCLLFVIIGLINISGKLFFGVTDVFGEWVMLSSSVGEFIVHPWTLVTYMFVQYDFLHLLFNMLWLYWFGQVFLLTLSDKHLLTLYLLGGIVGGVLFVIVSNLFSLFGGYSLLLGSSASVLAIMTAATMRSPNYEFHLFLFGSVKLKWIALVSIVLMFVGFGGSNSGGEIAHLGGVLTGFIFGYMLRQGHDILKPIYGMFERKTNKANRISTNSMEKTLNKRRRDVARLDELLDKIKQSGYESLTKKEKSELAELSKRLS